MLQSIRDFFDRNMAAGDRGQRHSIELATAALLVEVVRSDRVVDAAERMVVERAVREKFHLSPDEAARLFELAEAEVRQATDLYQFTTLVDRGFSLEQKIRIVELLWEVAFADTHLSAHEQHILWRIADLLHVSRGDYVAAKARAREAAGPGAASPAATP